MSKVWSTMKHEFFEVLPPTIFFLISFNIVLIDRALMLRQFGLHLASVAGASVLRDIFFRHPRVPLTRGA